jgi:hypothetical protein
MFLVVLIASALVAGASLEEYRRELKGMDQRIEQLEKERDLHMRKSQEFLQQGNQWQYETGDIQDAYTSWGKADDERARALQLQQEIDVLREQKERMFNLYPQLRSQ